MELIIKKSQIKKFYKRTYEDVNLEIYDAFTGSGFKYQVCSSIFDDFDGYVLKTNLKNCNKIRDELVEQFPKLKDSFEILKV